MNIENYKINNRVNIYAVKTEKFKTDLIGIYIKRPLNSKESAMNTLISRLMLRASETYQTTKALNVHLEESYGMILVADVVKYGDYQILQIKLQFPNGRYLGEAIFDSAVNTLKEVILKPLTLNGAFNPDYFQQEKNNLIDEIKGRVNDKMSYALERCIEVMYDQEDYAEYVYGDLKDIEAVSNEELYKHYQYIIDHSFIDICIMGENDPSLSSQYFTDFFKDKKLSPVLINNEHISQEVKRYEESFDVSQGKLVLGYQTGIDYTHPMYEASVLAYHILGGGPSSKLFLELREEKSLCYYVYAKTDKFKGNLFIGLGIQSEDYKSVIKLINLEILKLKTGSVSQQDLETAKESMLSSIRSLSDYPNSFINFFYTENLGKTDYTFDIDALVKSYERVTLEDIIEAYQNIKLDTIYFLRGQDEISQ